MTTDELLQALARLRVETGSLACLGCGYEHNCGVNGCRVLREAAALIEDQAITIRGLRFRLTGYHMEDSFNRGLLAAESQRRRKAEAERDVLLEQIKARRSCLDCKYFDYCEFDDATVIDCMNCVTKNCPCYQCGNSSRWEWRGLPESEEGEKHE